MHTDDDCGDRSSRLKTNSTNNSRAVFNSKIKRNNNGLGDIDISNKYHTNQDLEANSFGRINLKMTDDKIITIITDNKKIRLPRSRSNLNKLPRVRTHVYSV